MPFEVSQSSKLDIPAKKGLFLSKRTINLDVALQGSPSAQTTPGPLLANITNTIADGDGR